MRRLMKQGYTAVGVLIIVGVVLGLGVLFVLSDSPNPTGYAGSGAPVGYLIAPLDEEIPCSSDSDCTPPYTCQYYPGYGGYYCGDGCEVSCDTNSDCIGEFEGDCCDSEDSASCVEGSCECISNCEESDGCNPNPESGDEQCGGIVGGTPKPESCQPTDQYGENGGCDCDNDGCTEGASCSTFGELSVGPLFVNPCGPNGHCEITGSEDGSLFGICVCSMKPCELLDVKGFQGEPDQCETTVQCDEDSTCSSHDDCGGAGLGRCNEGICDCECVSWAPCQSDFNCGGYGEGGSGDGSYGQCVAGPDGAGECMCTDELGCSPLDCIPGVTPCTGNQDDCGGNGEDACSEGSCEECGYDCEFFCDGGVCSDDSGDLTQEDCDSIAAQIGTDIGCTLDEDGNCECDSIPSDICRRCYSTGSNFACGE